MPMKNAIGIVKKTVEVAQGLRRTESPGVGRASGGNARRGVIGKDRVGHVVAAVPAREHAPC